MKHKACLPSLGNHDRKDEIVCKGCSEESHTGDAKFKVELEALGVHMVDFNIEFGYNTDPPEYPFLRSLEDPSMRVR